MHETSHHISVSHHVFHASYNVIGAGREEEQEQRAERGTLQANQSSRQCSLTPMTGTGPAV